MADKNPVNPLDDAKMGVRTPVTAGSVTSMHTDMDYQQRKASREKLDGDASYERRGEYLGDRITRAHKDAGLSEPPQPSFSKGGLVKGCKHYGCKVVKTGWHH
jgi:hypothetical protein